MLCISSYLVSGFPSGGQLAGGRVWRTKNFALSTGMSLSYILPIDFYQYISCSEWDEMPTAVLWTSFQGWKLHTSNSCKQRMVIRACQENFFTLWCLGRDLQLPWRRQGTELQSRVPYEYIVKKYFEPGYVGIRWDTLGYIGIHWHVLAYSGYIGYIGWPEHLGPDQGEGYC